MESDSPRVLDLTELGMLRVHGPDAVRFLQGQVSNDTMRLTSQASLLAGYHNPQGRVIALLHLLQLSPEDILAVLPRELAAGVATRLSRFVLRAKVKVADESAGWPIRGLVGPSPSSLSLPDELLAQTVINGMIVVRIGRTTPRWLVLSPQGASDPLSSYDRADATLWRALDVEEGLPQVHASTSEAFVAQMLNLDGIGAVAFEKGCYTGQEVIARAHYRGRVKRRMQRFRTVQPATLSRGDSGHLSDGRSFKVVEAITASEGRCEFLAVAPLTSGADDEAGDASAQALHVEQLEMSYSLPE
jgi:tRNA-modifying protein YgfZ